MPGSSLVSLLPRFSSCSSSAKVRLKGTACIRSQMPWSVLLIYSKIFVASYGHVWEDIVFEKQYRQEGYPGSSTIRELLISSKKRKDALTF